jgi:dihydrodipicolinate synthase/N-acetylneuraminate lyase
MRIGDIPEVILQRLRDGCVIPAHPLALDNDRRLSEKHQRGLTRYYCDAGAGGIAVGVHSTQFEIRDPKLGLYEPVLSLAAETADAWSAASGQPILKIAGVSGRTEQALGEAGTAESLGYHSCLLSLRDLRDEDEETIVAHCREVAEVMPLVGFYLQPAVGGRLLPPSFWRAFASIENVVAIKISPFNRYQTFDVVRAVCEVGRQNDIALYTGNDDTIIFDLVSEYRVVTDSGPCTAGTVGGLLGHWGVWTRRAVEQFELIKAWRATGDALPRELLILAHEVTDSNAAFFDPANGFAGCLAGINEVLRRRGQVSGGVCLNPEEKLSSGQAEEIDRVHAAYPHLNDDAFVAEHLDDWLS